MYRVIGLSGLFMMVLIAIGCEPLAPPMTQEVLIVTSTPTATIPASPTRLPATAFSTPIQGIIPISPTPSEVIIPTATVPPCEETQGTVLQLSIESQVSNEEFPYQIYLPPCFFQSGRRYPYLILFHGAGYDRNQWLELGLQSVLEEGFQDEGFQDAESSLPPMVVVMPEGGIYQQENIFDPGSTYEDMILGELMPDIEQNFCLWTSAEGRAIGGISRGAFWAFSIGFRHPTLFGAIGGHSPFFVPDNAPASHNPLSLVESAAGIERIRIYLDSSQDDIGRSNNIVFSNALRQRGILHNYMMNPTGGHDNDYWSAHLYDYLEFYGQTWPVEVEELPSCQQ